MELQRRIYVVGDSLGKSRYLRIELGGYLREILLLNAKMKDCDSPREIDKLILKQRMLLTFLEEQIKKWL